MDPITWLVISVSMQIVGMLMMPKPEQPKPPSLDDYKEPTADAARPVPVVFGTVEMSGLNALWWGEKDVRKRKVSSGGKK